MTCGKVQTIFTAISDVDRLPIYSLLLRSIKGENTIQDDGVIGSRCSEYYKGRRTYCSSSPNSAICACVNSNVPYPHCSFGPCRSTWAYKPSVVAKCPSNVTICQNLSNIAGNKNIAEMSQELKCGGSYGTKYEVILILLFAVIILSIA